MDFLAPYLIGGVQTQGSADNYYWVTRYEVYYSNDGEQFYPVLDSPNSQTPRLFEGNSDQNTPVLNLFPLVSARYLRIRPVEFYGAIALRFNVFGCQSPSSTPSATPTVQPTFTSSFTTQGCLYWTQWVNSNLPQSGFEYESLSGISRLVHVCSDNQVIDIECRVASTGMPWDQAGQTGVTCDKNQRSLMCIDTADQTCFDYEIRVLCDECSSQTPTITQHSTSSSSSLGCGWSTWFNRDSDVSNGDYEQLNSQELRDLCPGGEITQIECNSVTDDQPYYLRFDLFTTCDLDTGFTCDAEMNFGLVCVDFKIRYLCECPGE